MTIKDEKTPLCREQTEARFSACVRELSEFVASMYTATGRQIEDCWIGTNFILASGELARALRATGELARLHPEFFGRFQTVQVLESTDGAISVDRDGAVVGRGKKLELREILDEEDIPDDAWGFLDDKLARWPSMPTSKEFLYFASGYFDVYLEEDAKAHLKDALSRLFSEDMRADIKAGAARETFVGSFDEWAIEGGALHDAIMADSATPSEDGRGGADVDTSNDEFLKKMTDLSIDAAASSLHTAFLTALDGAPEARRVLASLFGRLASNLGSAQ